VFIISVDGQPLTSAGNFVPESGVPEPGAAPLVGLGLSGFGILAVGRRSRANR
jgi:hypothetical protein